MLNPPLPQTETPKHPLSQLISQGSGRSPSAALINEAEEPDLKEDERRYPPDGGIFFFSVLFPQLPPKAATADVADGESRSSFVPQKGIEVLDTENFTLPVLTDSDPTAFDLRLWRKLPKLNDRTGIISV